MEPMEPLDSRFHYQREFGLGSFSVLLLFIGFLAFGWDKIVLIPILGIVGRLADIYYKF